MNVKLRKYFRLFLFIIVFIIISCLGLGVTLFRSGLFQTFITKQIISYYESKLNAEVRIKKIDIAFPMLIVAKELYISDQHKDTLIYAETLSLNFFNFINKNRRMEIEAIQLYNGRFNLCQYKNEKDLNVQFLIDAFDTGPSNPKLKPFENIIRNIKLYKIDFTYKNFNYSEPSNIINFDDIQTKYLFADLKNFSIVRDTFSMDIKQMSFVEKCGLRIKDFKAKTRISPSFLEFNKMSLNTGKSLIQGSFSFNMNDYDDFSDFESKVFLNGKLENTILQLSDTKYFHENMNGIDMVIQLNGQIAGTECNLKLKNLEIEYGKNTYFNGNITMRGLPDWQNTFTTLDIKKFRTHKKDLEAIPLYPFTEGRNAYIPKEIETLGIFEYKGNFSGFESEFVSYGSLSTDIGKISMDIEMQTDEKTGLAVYNGKIEAEKFNLGKYFDLYPMVNEISLTADIDGKGLKQNNVSANIAGSITSFGLNNYKYENIQVNGLFEKNVFSGIFTVSDENIEMSFDGDIDLRDTLPKFNFIADVRKADLKNLNFIETKNPFILSTTVTADFSGNDINNIIGNIQLYRTVEVQKSSGLLINNIEINSEMINDIKRISLNSDFINGYAEGKFDFKTISSSIQSFFYNYFPQYLKNKIDKNYTKNQYLKCEFETKNSAPLSKLILPGIVLMPKTKVKAVYIASEKYLDIDINGKSLLMGGVEMKNISFNAIKSQNSDLFTAKFDASKILLSDSSFIENVKLNSSILPDSVLLNLRWNNLSTEINKANIEGYISTKSTSVIKGKITESQIHIHDSLWQIEPDNLLTYDSIGFSFKKFKAFHKNEFIECVSLIDERENEYQHEITLFEFNVGWLNPFLKSSGTKTNGLASGKGKFYQSNNHLIFSCGIGVENLKINGELFGNASIVALYNDEKESVGINIKFLRGDLPSLAITGFYYPFEEENSLDLEIILRQFPINNLEGYTQGIFSDLRGLATGSLILSGTSSEPVLKGMVDIQRGSVLVDYINVAYSFSDKVYFSKNEINFSNVRLSDPKSNIGILTGKIKHYYFDDLNFDISLDANKIQVLNTTFAQNESFYGKAFATGKSKIHGTLNNLIFDIAVKSEAGTLVNIPLYGSEEITQNDFISFVVKDTSQKIKPSKQIDLSNIQMNFDLQMTPDAEIQMIFDPTVGDVISGNGEGNLKLNINTLGQFQMFGDYVIKDGKYLFTLQNIINKKFNIESGSSVSWNGDPLGANININAIYKARPGLSEILADSSGQRIPVECKLIMTEKLMKPNIKFDLIFPNAQAGIKEQIKAAINYDNEVELNKQIFSLLVLGSFFPVNNTNNTFATGVSSNTNELVSNQISNWMSGLSKQINLGFNFKNDQSANREVAVSLNKEFFNNKISVDGNFGVRNNTVANNIIGDVNIDYKITNDGRFRLKAFNQSNDYTSLINQAPFTQGVGIYYRQDFDNFKTLLEKYRFLIQQKNKQENPILKTQSSL